MEEKVKSQKSKVKSLTAKTKKVKAEGVDLVADLKPTKIAKPIKKTSVLHADVYDVAGKVVDTIALPEQIFGVKSNPRLIAQAVRVYLANQRAGSASTKSRGEVEGSSKKIYRQKGTGRARHGGIRAPIFVHGGIAHGPKPRDFSLEMPKKMKKAALYAALSEKVRSGKVKIVNGLENIEPKTKVMATLFAKIQDPKSKKILFILDTKNDNVIRSVRNINGVTYEYAKQLHTYEVMEHDAVIFMKNAIEVLGKDTGK